MNYAYSYSNTSPLLVATGSNSNNNNSNNNRHHQHKQHEQHKQHAAQYNGNMNNMKNSPHYYDPHSKCIQISNNNNNNNNNENNIKLSGVIVSPTNLPLKLQDNKILMGEIIEIYDSQEEKLGDSQLLSLSSKQHQSHYDGYDDGDDDGGYTNGYANSINPATTANNNGGSGSTGSTTGVISGSADGLLTLSFVESLHHQELYSKKELLLQKQRQLQTNHAQQNQKLSHKHKKDRRWFHEQNLNEDRLLELETLHYNEWMDMLSRHQKEQREMMDLVLHLWCESNSHPRQKSVVESPKEQLVVETQQQQSMQTEKEKQLAQLFASAAASHKVVAIPSPKAVMEAPTLDNTNDHTNNPHNPNLTNNDESNPTAPIHIATPTAPTANTATNPPSSHSTTSTKSLLSDRISHDRQKANEIKSVMRNRNLTKKERQDRLAEIKERYSTNNNAGGSVSAAATTAVKAESDSAVAVANDVVVEPAMDEKTISERRRRETQSVMRDRTMGKKEKQKEISRIKSKYAAMNRAAVKTVMAANVLSRTTAATVGEVRDSNQTGDDAAAAVEESNNSTTTKDKVARRWNKAVVNTVTTSMISRPMDTKEVSDLTGTSDDYAAVEEFNTTTTTNTAVERQLTGSNSKDKVARRWNKAVVNTATAGMITRPTPTREVSDLTGTSDDYATVEESNTAATAVERKLTGGSSKYMASKHWNKAVVKTATANMLTRPMDVSVNSSGVSVDLVFDGGLPSIPDEAAVSYPTDDVDKPASSNHTSQSTIPKDDENPLDEISTDRTPIKKLIKKLDNDDPSLTVLKLDGRKKIKKADWESLFESLEQNATLTHLSVSRCDISDEMAVSLVLALVENEALVEMRLNSNKELTDGTSKGLIKVLLQSNKTLKKLEMNRTKVTKKSMAKLNGILEERDEKKKATKLQEEREKKIKQLLSFSAGDQVAKETAAKVGAPDSENDEETLGELMDASFMSKASKQSRMGGSVTSGISKRGKHSSRRTTSGASIASGTSSRRKTPSKKMSGGASVGASVTSMSSGARAGRGGGARRANRAGRGGNRQRSIMQASMTAQAMAQLGGDIANVGADTVKLKEQRKLRGECEICGRKTHTKTMFKTTPLTIPNVVLDGRCLICNPMM